jgi:hypothetical protein
MKDLFGISNGAEPTAAPSALIPIITRVAWSTKKAS